jgi:hypothetical protein
MAPSPPNCAIVRRTRWISVRGIAVVIGLFAIVAKSSAYDVIKVRLKDQKTSASIPDATIDLVFTTLNGESVQMQYDPGKSIYTAPGHGRYVDKEAKVKITFPSEPFQGADRPKYKFWGDQEPTSITVTAQFPTKEYAALRYPDFYSSVALVEAGKMFNAGNIEKEVDYLKEALMAVPSVSTYQRLCGAIERLLPNPSDSGLSKIKEFVTNLKGAEWLGPERFTLLLDFSATVANRQSKNAAVHAAALDAIETAIALQETDARVYSAKYQLLDQSGDPGGAAQVIKTFFDNNEHPPKKNLITFANDWLAYIEKAAGNGRPSDVPTSDQLVGILKRHEEILRRTLGPRRYNSALTALQPETPQ